MDESRLEKRIKSIRSLPQGQFSKYRQMFDSLMKNRCRDKCREMLNGPNTNKKDGKTLYIKNKLP